MHDCPVTKDFHCVYYSLEDNIVLTLAVLDSTLKLFFFLSYCTGVLMTWKNQFVK